MNITNRLRRLEHADRNVAPDGRRRCRLCRDGVTLVSVAKFSMRPDWVDPGDTGACAACGREAEAVLVVGVDPETL